MTGCSFPRRTGLVAVVVVLMLVAGAGGAAAGVAYLKLGMSNTSNVTTTLTGATTGAELSVRNTKNHPALALTVPAGVPPMRVNSTGTVANLSADLLDGIDSSGIARGNGIRTLATRRVVPGAQGSHQLLSIPGLGVVRFSCEPTTDLAWITWFNDRTYPIDFWSDYFDVWSGSIIGPATGQAVAHFDGSTGDQRGSSFHLGVGNDGDPRRLADVRIHAYRGGTGQPCGFNVIATTWKSQ